MSINVQLIIPVFQELVKHKPKLAYLLPEDDDEEEIDIRRLGHELINSFPWPIGNEFRLLFSPGCDALNQRRLYQILKIIERSLQCIAFVLLSQLLNESAERELTYPDERFRQELPSSFRTLTLGTYLWLLNSLGQIFTANGLDPFIPEMQPLLTKKFTGKLHQWRHIRNKISHYLINLEEEEIQKRCVDFQKDLSKVCADIAFFVKYPLVTVRDIRVNKQRRKPPTFIHTITRLPDFADKQRQYAAYTDNYEMV